MPPFVDQMKILSEICNETDVILGLCNSLILGLQNMRQFYFGAIHKICGLENIKIQFLLTFTKLMYCKDCSTHKNLHKTL